MRKNARGQVAAEAALAMTAFMLLLTALLDFGRGFWAWQTLNVVAREGARWGIVHGADTGLSTDESEAQGMAWVQSRFGQSLPAQAKVTFSWPGGTNAPGNSVRVAVKSDYQPLTPLLGKKKVTLSGVSEMQILH